MKAIGHKRLETTLNGPFLVLSCRRSDMRKEAKNGKSLIRSLIKKTKTKRTSIVFTSDRVATGQETRRTKFFKVKEKSANFILRRRKVTF